MFLSHSDMTDHILLESNAFKNCIQVVDGMKSKKLVNINRINCLFFKSDYACQLFWDALTTGKHEC